MRRLLNLRIALACVAVTALMVVSGLRHADARPAYLKGFLGKYEENKEVTEAAKEAKCNVCHYGKSKKNRNNYGAALMKAIGKKNEKDAKKIEEALTKTEKAKSLVKDGDKAKTFGEVIKDGKLPAEGFKEPKKDE